MTIFCVPIFEKKRGKCCVTTFSVKGSLAVDVSLQQINTLPYFLSRIRRPALKMCVLRANRLPSLTCLLKSYKREGWRETLKYRTFWYFILQRRYVLWPTQQPVCTRWFKYDRDWLCVNKSQFVPVIFEPLCINSSRRTLYHKSKNCFSSTIISRLKCPVQCLGRSKSSQPFRRPS